jgi:hypothetical protein
VYFVQVGVCWTMPTAKVVGVFAFFVLKLHPRVAAGSERLNAKAG